MIDPAHARRLGEVVGGKYRIVRFLATGGMGVVFEAQHEVVKRRFAVKFLRPDLAQRRDVLTRFQREAQAAGALECENLTAAVDFGIASDGAPYIVMEYLAGESLASLLEREGRLPIGRAADLVVQACRGMQVAHAAGIVHRDLKPQNLFVCRREDGSDLLKVLDFGVAKLQALDALDAATRTGTVMGTPSYMSPEQARGDKVIDQRTDVYALAAILYELVSGQMPHPGDSHNAVLHHISTQPAVSLGSVQPGLPAAFIELVDRTLSSQPSGRPPSAEAFGKELGPLARRQVWPAGPADDVDRVRAEGPSSTPAGPPNAVPPSTMPVPEVADAGKPPSVTAAPAGPALVGARKQPGRGRRLWLVAAAALVAVVAGVALRQGKAPQGSGDERRPMGKPGAVAPPPSAAPPSPGPDTSAVDVAPRAAPPAAVLPPAAPVPAAVVHAVAAPSGDSAVAHAGRPHGRPGEPPGGRQAARAEVRPAGSPARPARATARDAGASINFDPNNPYN